MRNLTEANVTEAVLNSVAGTRDPRLKQVIQSFVRHLHAFLREVEPTEEEWLAGIRFLTEVGQTCSALRQEYILLSDVLGATILMDAINHRRSAAATPSSVLGPFYRAGAPLREIDANIAGETPGHPCDVSGTVRTADGRPVAGAELDVWQTAPNGMYEGQDPSLPEMTLRGRFRTSADGAYAFRTLLPVSYPIPDDGPVGKLLKATGRHPYRPAHIHFIVTAEGYEPLVTQVFVDGDGYLESDAVFGVKDALVAAFVRHDSPEEAARRGLAAPFYTMHYDFGLQPAAASSQAA